MRILQGPAAVCSSDQIPAGGNACPTLTADAAGYPFQQRAVTVSARDLRLSDRIRQSAAGPRQHQAWPCATNTLYVCLTEQHACREPRAVAGICEACSKGWVRRC